MFLKTQTITLEIEEPVYDRDQPGAISEMRVVTFTAQDMTSYQTLMFLLEAKNYLLDGVELQIGSDSAQGVVHEIYQRFMLDPVAMVKALSHEAIKALAPMLFENVKYCGEFVSLGKVSLESLGQVFYNWNSILELAYQVIRRNFLYFLPNAPQSFHDLTSSLLTATPTVSE